MPDIELAGSRGRNVAPFALLCIVGLAGNVAAEPVPFPSPWVDRGSGGRMEPAGPETGDSAGTAEAPRGGFAPGLDPLDTARFAGSPYAFGGLGAPLGLVAPPEPGRTWTVVPSIGLQFLATDNLYETQRNRRSDFITSISPGIYVAADTPRLQLGLNYLPSIQFYANSSDQNRVEHYFSGQANVAVIPGTAYVDVRGAAANQTVTGGFAPEGTTVVGEGNRVQTTSFQISPYLLHRFGGLATAQVGYAFGYSSADGDDAVLPGGTQPYFTSQHSTSNTIFGVLRSGEDFGRIGLEARATGTTFSGTGVLDGAHRNVGALQVSYAVTRELTVMASGGYEDQRYATAPPTEISGPTWSFGARLTPSDESSILVRYGRQNGFNSAFVDAGVSLGARTRLYASYSDGLTTSTLQSQDLLSTTTLSATGNPVNSNTGAPVYYGSGLLGVQDSLFRSRRAAIGITHAWPRDTVTLSLYREEQRPVGVAPGTVAFSQRGVSGSITWAHELSPVTTAIAYAQYGTNRSPTFGSGDVATFSASLVHRLTPLLSASVQYALTNRTWDGSGDSIQNILLVALRQEF
jgi:uncharacterized protein (PEP-CTERM system associated)